jgi:acetyl-CoA carboxylase beta subunit
MALSLDFGHLINCLTSHLFQPRLEVVLYTANPTSGGVTASTEMLAAKRHAGVHTPVIVGKMIIANQQMAYAA